MEKNLKHTQGTWNIDPNSNKQYNNRRAVMCDGKKIAIIEGYTDTEDEANANLIVTAVNAFPLLVDALQTFVQVIDLSVETMADGERLETYKTMQKSLTYTRAKEALKVAGK